MHPGKIHHPTYRLFTLNMPRGSGIKGARPVFRAREQVEDVLLKFAKTRMGRPRREPGIMRAAPPTPTVPFTRQTDTYSLARARLQANLLATR